MRSGLRGSDSGKGTDDEDGRKMIKLHGPSYPQLDATGCSRAATASVVVFTRRTGMVQFVTLRELAPSLLHVGIEDTGLDRACVLHLDEDAVGSRRWKAIREGHGR